MNATTPDPTGPMSNDSVAMSSATMSHSTADTANSTRVMTAATAGRSTVASDNWIPLTVSNVPRITCAGYGLRLLQIPLGA